MNSPLTVQYSTGQETSTISQMTGTLAYVRAHADEITENGARVTVGGVPEFITDDGVIVAVGPEVDDSFARSLEGQAPEFYVIGDANGNGRIREATAEGIDSE